MTVVELVAIIVGVSSLVTALSVLYSKLIHPFKKIIKQVEDNTQKLKWLEDKIIKLKAERADDNAFDKEVRAILIESLIAILDGLEQNGANHAVTDQKKKLISFMSKQINGN